MTVRASSPRPMRELLAQLQRLQLTDNTGEVDLRVCSSVLLADVAEDAETTISTIHQGLGAIGHLLAHSAVPIEDGTIGADSMESLGFLMAELGDLAAACMTLAARCRRAIQASGPPPPGWPPPSPG
ncbi:hypothetical protein J2739_001769 [Variovorax soli]|uniref:Uncharacterized protein n=1 Tax=Variovorax soli TaxID=376815 RepID=A0ABU1NC47_9BURK|nr:hypothetical protein [Variovorax soli]